MSFNQTQQYMNLEMLLTSIGQTWVQNYIWTVVDSSCAIIGFILNILNLVVLNDAEFSLPLYDYLRVYSLNGAVMLLFASSIGFCSTSYKLFEWADSGWATTYYVYAYIPIVNTGYFFASVLDSLITLDRIACFNTQLKQYIRLSPYKASMIAYLACVLVNFPYFFVYRPNSRQVLLNSSQPFTLWASSTTDFAKSQAGTIVTFVVYAIRDVGTMLIEIVLNLISLYYLNQYLKRKSVLLHFNNINSTTKTSHLLNRYNRYEKTTNVTTVNADSSIPQESKEESDRNPVKKLTVMVIFICLISVLEHILVLAGITYSYFSTDPNYSAATYRILQAVFNLSITIKQLVNFPLFFIFNKNFKRSFYKLFRF